MYKNYEIEGTAGTEGAVMRKLKTRVLLVREGRSRKTMQVQNPADAYRFLAGEARNLDREHFWRMDLDGRNQVLGYEVVSVGTLTASLVHPREVFKGAILANAGGIILAHNHPSGEARPSSEDREVTRRLTQVGKLIGIPVLDHITLADRKFFSFREQGLMGDRS